jgi:hypothetical protein
MYVALDCEHCIWSAQCHAVYAKCYKCHKCLTPGTSRLYMPLAASALADETSEVCRIACRSSVFFLSFFSDPGFFESTASNPIVASASSLTPLAGRPDSVLKHRRMENPQQPLISPISSPYSDVPFDNVPGRIYLVFLNRSREQANSESRYVVGTTVTIANASNLKTKQVRT